MSNETIPKDLRGLRACLVCALLKSFHKFQRDGCDNCDDFLHMKDNKTNIYHHTTSNFHGMIFLMSPNDSWQWQKLGRLATGIYAISVLGTLPAATLREMKRRGIPYKTRDTTHC